MASSSIRQIHAIISGALDTAVRWEWIHQNPAAVAKRPKQPAPNPKPPTAAQAAELVNAAQAEDEQWGALVWLVMVTGARRGELLALRVCDLVVDEGVINIEKNYINSNGREQLKTTKTHQVRRPALDPETVLVRTAQIDRIAKQRHQLGLPPDDQAFLFSYEPDHGRPCHPDGITHRYSRMCKRLGIDSHLHALRHYSVTELIRAGVDIRTVAGRLGGTTTLRVNAAWVAKSNRRAMMVLAARLPGRAP